MLKIWLRKECRSCCRNTWSRAGTVGSRSQGHLWWWLVADVTWSFIDNFEWNDILRRQQFQRVSKQETSPGFITTQTFAASVRSHPSESVCMWNFPELAKCWNANQETENKTFSLKCWFSKVLLQLWSRKLLPKRLRPSITESIATESSSLTL